MKYFRKVSCIPVFLLFFAAIPSKADIISAIDFEDIKAGPADSHPDLRQSGNDPQVVTSQNGVNPKDGNFMMKAYLNRKSSPTNYRTEVIA